MGWYGNDEVKCNNCNKSTAVDIARNDLASSYCIVCTNCGFLGYKELYHHPFSFVAISTNKKEVKKLSINPNDIPNYCIENKIVCDLKLLHKINQTMIYPNEEKAIISKLLSLNAIDKEYIEELTKIIEEPIEFVMDGYIKLKG